MFLGGLSAYLRTGFGMLTLASGVFDSDLRGARGGHLGCGSLMYGLVRDAWLAV